MKRIMLAGTVTLLLAGCAGQQTKPDQSGAVPVEPVTEAEKQAGEHGGLPVTSGNRGGVEVIPIDQQEEGGAEGVEGLRPDEAQAGETQQNAALAYPPVVYFDTDSDVVSEEGRQVLKYYADKLLAQPDVKVRLEGHTDERGTPDYNLALGERRAKAVRQVLELYGVPTERIEVISYGEERPAVQGHDEAAWSKNRRVELVFIK